MNQAWRLIMIQYTRNVALFLLVLFLAACKGGSDPVAQIVAEVQDSVMPAGGDPEESTDVEALGGFTTPEENLDSTGRPMELAPSFLNDQEALLPPHIQALSDDVLTADQFTELAELWPYQVENYPNCPVQDMLGGKLVCNGMQAAELNAQGAWVPTTTEVPWMCTENQRIDVEVNGQTLPFWECTRTVETIGEAALWFPWDDTTESVPSFLRDPS